MSPRAQKPPVKGTLRRRDASKRAPSKEIEAKRDASKVGASKNDSAKNDSQKSDLAKSDSQKKNAPKPDVSKGEASKSEASKNSGSKSDNTKRMDEKPTAEKVPTSPASVPGTEPEVLRSDGSVRPPPSAKQLEDKALVQRARTGDQLAYNELVKRHRHGVERLIRPMVRSASSDEVEDLVQEALTKAMLHLTSYSEDYAFSTWLYRIATNHAIDYLRRRKLNAFSISAPPTGLSSRHDDEGKEYEISDSSWVPDDVLLSGERTNLIEAAIDQLPENYRRIIRLRHNDDMEYEEIAQVLKLPMGTVKVHLHRARAALARMLEGKI